MDKSPSAVLRSARGDARPFALFGDWSNGRALIGSEPVVVVEDPVDPFSVLDEQPEIDEQPAITVPSTGATGGGWVGYLGYGLGRLVERLPAPPTRPVPVRRSFWSKKSWRRSTLKPLLPLKSWLAQSELSVQPQLEQASARWGPTLAVRAASRAGIRIRFMSTPESVH